jgi:hypothetical protein
MRITFVIALFVAVPIAVAQHREEEGIDVLVKRLGSGDFRQREAATEALKRDPKSAPLLREALRSPNLEIVRRAATILEYHERRPVRELESAVKEGRIEAVIGLLAEWPSGKHEPEAWDAVRDLTRTVAKLHQKQGGKDLDIAWLDKGVEVVVVSEPAVEEVRNNMRGKDGIPYFFVRTRSVELAPISKPRSDSGYNPGGVFVASQSVKIRPLPSAQLAILAGGSVEIGGFPFGCVVISGGDVSISTESLLHSLVIARGKVTCGDVRMGYSRIISGKSVTYNKKMAGNCIITENEPNPLGFIRWSDAPKEISPAKAKEASIEYSGRVESRQKFQITSSIQRRPSCPRKPSCPASIPSTRCFSKRRPAIRKPCRRFLTSMPRRSGSSFARS